MALEMDFQLRTFLRPGKGWSRISSGNPRLDDEEEGSRKILNIEYPMVFWADRSE